MIILGVICLIIGFVAAIPILWTIGIILCVIGLILLLVGSRRDAAYTGRRWYY